MTDFPRTVDEITVEWLTGALRASGAIGEARVESFEISEIDGGFIGGVNRIELTYDRQEAGAPGTIIAKFAIEDDEMRRPIDDAGLYEREVRFYRELSSASGVATPEMYFAEYDGATGHFMLLLEDLSHLRAVDQFDGCNTRDAGAALKFLAAMHSGWWESTRLAEYGWLYDPGDARLSRKAQEDYSGRLDAFIEIARSLGLLIVVPDHFDIYFVGVALNSKFHPVARLVFADHRLQPG